MKREDLFITSKLFNDQFRKEHVRPALLRTLQDLQLSYLDLYLMHLPCMLFVCCLLTMLSPSVYMQELHLCGVGCYFLISHQTNRSTDAIKNTGPAPNFATTEFDYVPASETWATLEELVKEGLVKNIGISNFNFQSTLDLLGHAKIRPQVNQIVRLVGGCEWVCCSGQSHMSLVLFCIHSVVGNPPSSYPSWIGQLLEATKHCSFCIFPSWRT